MHPQNKPQIKDQWLKEIVGLSSSQAGYFADLRGLSFRVISNNSIPMGYTGDYNIDRLNFTIIDDIVVKAHYG